MIIGIDPGKNTGVAIYKNGKFLTAVTTNFWAAIDIISSYSTFDPLVIVELPETKAVWHNAKNKAAQNRVAVNVGSVLREAELIVEYLKNKGIRYSTRKPAGKFDAKLFKKITGIDARLSQHARDAAMLCLSV